MTSPPKYKCSTCKDAGQVLVYRLRDSARRDVEEGGVAGLSNLVGSLQLCPARCGAAPTHRYDERGRLRRVGGP